MVTLDVNEYGDSFQMENIRAVRLMGQDFGLAYLIDGVVFRMTHEVIGDEAIYPYSILKLTPINTSNDEDDSLARFCKENGDEAHKPTDLIKEIIHDMRRGIYYEDRFAHTTRRDQAEIYDPADGGPIEGVDA
jgi:hypothetical protein